MVSAGPRREGVAEALRRIWREEGFAGFMRGNGSNVARIFPFSAIQLSSFPLFKQMMGEAVGGPKSTLAPMVGFTSGVASGVLATLVTYPLDFIR